MATWHTRHARATNLGQLLQQVAALLSTRRGHGDGLMGEAPNEGLKLTDQIVTVSNDEAGWGGSIRPFVLPLNVQSCLHRRERLNTS